MTYSALNHMYDLVTPFQGNNTVHPCDNIDFGDGIVGQLTSDNDPNYTSFDNNLFSTILNRSKMKESIEPYFSFSTSYKEIDFISEHSSLYEMLLLIRNSVMETFDCNAQIELEYFQEDELENLFVNINTMRSWEDSDHFLESAIENLYCLYPNELPLLNINMIPDVF